MKKLLFVIVLLGIAISFNGVSSKEALNSDSQGINALQSEVYQFNVPIYWCGDEGVGTFSSPEGADPGGLQIREYPSYILSVSRYSPGAFKMSIKKDFWESQGKPSTISVGLFLGYGYWGQAYLEFTN